MKTTLDCTPPWNLTTIQRMLMEGFKEGARLAVSDRQVREDATDASDLEEAFSGATRRAAEEAARRFTDRLASDFPDGWKQGLKAVMTSAVEAALVLGARAIANADVVRVADLAQLADDELWMGREVEHFLLQVVQSLVVRGHPLPGAQAFLDRVCPAPGPDLLELGQGARREVRTSWIRDSDTAHVYQWCARREGRAVVVGKRLRGSTSAGTEIAVLPGDLEVLVRVLKGAAEAPVPQ